jgi:hypothetical protein
MALPINNYLVLSGARQKMDGAVHGHDVMIAWQSDVKHRVVSEPKNSENEMPNQDKKTFQNQKGTG